MAFPVWLLLTVVVLHGEARLRFREKVIVQITEVERTVDVACWRVELIGAAPHYLLLLMCSDFGAIVDVKVRLDSVDAASQYVVHDVLPHHLVADGALREELAVVVGPVLLVVVLQRCAVHRVVVQVHAVHAAGRSQVLGPILDVVADALLGLQVRPQLHLFSGLVRRSELLAVLMVGVL